MSLKPLYDRVLVKTIKPEDTLQRGIVIPDRAKDKPQEAEVLALAAGTASRTAALCQST
jgi:chaperonin GroES